MQDRMSNDVTIAAAPEATTGHNDRSPSTCWSACPVCGGSFTEIRHKLHCTRCHSIIETCCEGGRG